MGTENAKYAPRINEVPAFDKLIPAGLSPEVSLEALEEAKAEIKEARQLLNH